MGHWRNQRGYQKTNDNENTTTQNLWVATKADIRGKFRRIQSTSRNRSHQIKWNTDEENNCKNTFDKGLVFRIYKELFTNEQQKDK